VPPHIRRATAADIEALSHLLADFELEVGDSLAESERPTFFSTLHRYLTASLAEDSATAWCAQSGDNLVACGLLTINAGPPTPGDPSGRWGYLSRIYTAPAWRGQGIATALIREALAYARACGLGRVMLTATPSTRGLYRSLGFHDFLGMMQTEL
jgi:ribosomal protein S18 acetylase RimI-like enzyme